MLPAPLPALPAHSFPPSPSSASPAPPAMPIKAEEPRDKKPRIRHTEAQLAALNELYDENEHPSLEERAALAERLGMDAKAVNAWFANKRSATKKKTKGFGTGTSSTYTSPPPSHDEDEDYRDRPQQHSRLSTPLGPMDQPTIQGQPSLPDVDSENRHVFDSEMANGIPRRMRMRPSAKQTEELRKLYATNTHPLREEREALGDRIGMKYQSVTNWFQNQRSLARKRADEEPHEHKQRLNNRHPYEDYQSDSRPEPRSYSSYPPMSVQHPSLPSSSVMSSPAIPHSLLGNHEPIQDHKLAALRRLGAGAPISRPRRTRPEPYQLEALKKLFARTTNPSIEERGALALEIGMDIGKVTNWFRNLRQTARKRAQKSNTDDGDDDSMDFDSVSVSRAGTPAFQSTASSYSSSMDGDAADRMSFDIDMDAHHTTNSDGGSEEDDQEAVTPPPAAPRLTGRRRMDVGFLTGSPSADELPKAASSKDTRASVEDALLLLGLSQQVA